MDYYVNGVTGSDSAACGLQISTPCKTVKQALANISSGTDKDYVKIARGTYVEGNMQVAADFNIVFEGGWDSGFTSNTCNPANTIIKTGNSDSGWEPLFGINNVAPGKTAAMEIRCVTLRKVDSGDIDEAVKVEVSHFGNANLVLDKVRITGFTQWVVQAYMFDPGTNSGGVIYATMNEVVLENNTGTPVQMAASYAGQVTLDMQRCSILNNGDVDKSSYALGLSSTDSGKLDAVLNNCLIAGNTGKYAGEAGISVNGSDNSTLSLKLVNSTITDNLCNSGGCGLSIYGGQNAQVSISMDNTILYGNRAQYEDSGTDLFISKYPATATVSFVGDYSILGEHKTVGQPSYISNHEINEDPELDSTYHLQQGSPAIDAGICGTNYFVYWRIAPYDDIDGDKRPGYGALLGCDIGADEYAFPWSAFLPAITRHSHHQ